MSSSFKLENFLAVLLIYIFEGQDKFKYELESLLEEQLNFKVFNSGAKVPFRDLGQPNFANHYR
jgi:hypothetical protein